MYRIIDERYLLKYHGGIIQTIALKNANLVRVEFEVYEENEEGIVYSKLYPTEGMAIQSIKQFLLISNKGPKGISGLNRDKVGQRIIRAKIQLFQDVVNNDILLPDSGEGYLLKNDKQYLLLQADELASQLT